jgi:hypothetical protein
MCKWSINQGPKGSIPYLQPLSVPKARIRKMPFWAFSDSRDRFTHISTDSTRIEMRQFGVICAQLVIEDLPKILQDMPSLRSGVNADPAARWKAAHHP